jgi:hypothetical protein
MGKRINWEYANIRDKVAGTPFDNSYDCKDASSVNTQVSTLKYLRNG